LSYEGGRFVSVSALIAAPEIDDGRGHRGRSYICPRGYEAACEWFTSD